jgi:hypothetical protein
MPNPKRLAISAFVAGALAYPAFTASWHSFEMLPRAYDSSWWEADQKSFEDGVIAERGITRAQFDEEKAKIRKEQQELCLQNLNKERPSISRDAAEAEESLCFMPVADHLPEFSVKTLLLALLGAAYSLHTFAFDAFIGGVASAALAWFGPCWLATYSRWLNTIPARHRITQGFKAPPKESSPRSLHNSPPQT